MGGLQVVFTGDFLQLPPVAPLKSVTLSAYFTQESSTSGSGSASSSSFNRVPSRSQSDPVRSRPSQKPVSAPALTLFQRTDRTSTSIPTESKALTEATSGNALASLSQRPETQKARFCFQSTVWGEIIGTNTFVLTNIFRQSDAVFASLLNSVRCGELTGDEPIVCMMHIDI